MKQKELQNSKGWEIGWWKKKREKWLVHYSIKEKNTN